MRLAFLAALLAVATPVYAADPKPPEPAAKPDSALPPLPADRTVAQSAVIAGKSIAYDVTVGTLPLYDDKGKKTGEVVYTAYLAKGGGARPVTFAFNGGPGAASVYLNLGAIGPKRIQFGAQGDSPSDPARLRDNPGTWLDFTDLVFIDPVGTGYSRSLVKREETDKAFFMIDKDIQYLSRIVYDWLTKNGRMASPKYVVGESYGGYRAPAIAHALQTDMGVGVSGVVMVSPALDGKTAADPDVSPMSWVGHFAVDGGRQLRAPGQAAHGPAQMAEVETYARTDYVTDLLRGREDPAAIERIVQKVAAYTGLDPKPSSAARAAGSTAAPSCANCIAIPAALGSMVRSQRHRLRSLSRGDAAAVERSDPRRRHGARHRRRSRSDDAHRRLEGRGALQSPVLCRERRLGLGSQRRCDRRSAQGDIGRSQDGGGDRARHGRSLLPLFRQPPRDRSAARLRPPRPRPARFVRRRPHVLQPRRQRRRFQENRTGDLRPIAPPPARGRWHATGVTEGVAARDAA
jgi:hypothetical protein